MQAPAHRLSMPKPPAHDTVGRLLLLLGHPALHRSKVNRPLLAAIRGLEGLTYHDLYEAYPDFDIDVDREKSLLTNHPILVWQHPFYWYNLPPLMKEWQDRVLEFGWAYGPGGEALRGKLLLPVISTGGREDAYQQGGFNRYTMRELLAPLDQTAHLCGIKMLPPFVVHSAHQRSDEEMRTLGAQYRRLLIALRDGALPLQDLDALPNLNELAAGLT